MWAMLGRPSLALVDDDAQRRARICMDCARAGLHIEPYESPHDLIQRAAAMTVLVHDREGWLEEIVGQFADRALSLAAIGFSEGVKAAKVADAIFAGALDYLEWPFDPDQLIASLERVSNRRALVLERRDRAAQADALLRKLSPRERDVVAHMAQGLTNKAIGRELQISPRTVEIHRSNALGKLGVDSTAAAIRLALEASQRST